MNEFADKLRKAKKSTASRCTFAWKNSLEEMQRAKLDMTTPIGKVLLFLQTWRNLS